jgi:CRISPR-associated protein Csx16
MPSLGLPTKNLDFDRQFAHLDINDIRPGDSAIGCLPVNLAAEMCQRGAAYIHMVLTVPEHWRGKELSVEQMIACGARLESYELKKTDCVQK